jgi:spermidine synthase
VLVVGLGAALLSNRFQALGARVETVELNPQMVEIAERWFGFNPPAGEVHIGDGRRFLTETKGPYDLIFLDAFSGEAVPGQILTVESFRRCRELLKPDGALLLNYVGFSTGTKSVVPEMIFAGMRTAFPQVDVFAVGHEESRDNLAFVARPQTGTWAPVPADLPCPEDQADAIRRFTDHRRSLKEGARVFTDDWHPADWLDRENRLQWRRESLRLFRDAGLDRVSF